MENGVKDFTDLDVWKQARKLRSATYRACNFFPKDENYSLVPQMRRAAISVSANIAEGYGRYSFQENIQFCRQGRASAYELRDHYTTALDAGYISAETFEQLNTLAISVIKLLNGYIRATRTRKLEQAKRRIAT